MQLLTTTAIAVFSRQAVPLASWCVVRDVSVVGIDGGTTSLEVISVTSGLLRCITTNACMMLITTFTWFLELD